MMSKLATTQLALFFENKIQSPIDLWTKVQATDWMREFSVVNSFLQLPDAGDATDGFPQIDVATATKNARMTIARTRADLFIDPPGFKTIDEAKEELLSYYKNFAEFFDQQTKNRIVRIGFVTKHILKHSEPNEALRKWG